MKSTSGASLRTWASCSKFWCDEKTVLLKGHSSSQIWSPSIVLSRAPQWQVVWVPQYFRSSLPLSIRRLSIRTESWRSLLKNWSKTHAPLLRASSWWTHGGTIAGPWPLWCLRFIVFATSYFHSSHCWRRSSRAMKIFWWPKEVIISPFQNRLATSSFASFPAPSFTTLLR